MHDNNLNGSLPSSLGQLASLDTLNLGRNALAGSIPSDLGDLGNLRVAYLQRNQFTGEIPSELGGMSNLTLLNLRYNQLTGAVPAELGDLASLETLNLRDNQFTGPLPGELTDLSLTRFLVSGNGGLCRPADDSFTTWLNGINDTDALDLELCESDAPERPARPSGLAATSDTDTPARTMELSFGEVTGAVAANSQYRAKGREQGAAWSAWTTLAGVTASNGSVEGQTAELSAGKAYEVQVRACGETQSDEACSDASEPAFGATPASSPGTAVAGPTSPASQAALAFSWSIAGAADHHDAAYEIGYSADTADAEPATMLDAEDVPAFTQSETEVTGLETDTEYKLFVRSHVSWGSSRYFESPWASATARTEPDTPEPPVRPSGLAATSDTDTPARTMELSFGEVADAVAANSQYRARGREQGAAWSAWTTLAGVTASNGNVEGRTAEHSVGKAYEVQVRACGETQSDDACSDASESAFGATPASSPGGASAGPASPASQTALAFSWSIADAADHHDAAYDIGYSADTADAEPATMLDAEDVPAFTQSQTEVTGLETDTEYKFFVRSHVSWGNTRYFESSWASATARTEPEETPPGSPDRGILANLYNATGGADWTNATNWLNSNVALDAWHGVTADTADAVLVLNLFNNNLADSLPGSLSRLSSLDSLNLGRNQLTGPLPPQLGDFDDLQVAYLQRNQFTGEIPPELGGMTNLTLLNLRDNQLTGPLPGELTNLSLTRFLVSGNGGLCRPADDSFTAWLNGIDNTDALDLELCESDTPERPARPSGLAATSDTDTPARTMELSFGEVTGAVAANSQYRARGREQGAAWSVWTTLAGVTASNGSVEDRTAELSAGKAYEVQVRACGETQSDEACSDASEPAFGATPASSPGGAVAGPTSPASQTKLAFSWSVANAADHHDAAYDIGYSADTAAAEPATMLDAADTPAFTQGQTEVTGLAPDTEYKLFVRSHVSWGNTRYFESPWASAKARTEPEATDPPADPRDRTILTALHNATGGASWTTSTNWLDTASVLNDWYGVSADSVDHVSRIHLPGNQLTGTLPASLGGLADVDTLDLGDNQLTGAIPPEIGGLAGLKVLDLGSNGLTGEIPLL